MPDNMMRVAGRGNDGNAKAIKTDNGGRIVTAGVRDYPAQFSVTKTLGTSFPDNVIDIQSDNINAPIEFDYIYISSTDSVGVLVEPNDNTYTRRSGESVSIDTPGGITSTPGFGNIKEGLLDGWEMVKDDENFTVVKTNKNIYMPFGGRIRLQRIASDATVSVVASYKELNI